MCGSGRWSQMNGPLSFSGSSLNGSDTKLVDGGVDVDRGGLTVVRQQRVAHDKWKWRKCVIVGEMSKLEWKKCRCMRRALPDGADVAFFMRFRKFVLFKWDRF
eukprot:1935552-Amphidinium_carterae.1